MTPALLVVAVVALLTLAAMVSQGPQARHNEEGG